MTGYPVHPELWEFDIDGRTWRTVETTGRHPGPRSGHGQFAYGGDMYVWGGVGGGDPSRARYSLVKPDLYRLRMRGVKRGPFIWELVKTKIKPPARTEFAGTVYKGKVRGYQEGKSVIKPLLLTSSFLRKWYITCG